VAGAVLVALLGEYPNAGDTERSTPLHAVANDPSAARLTAPPMKRRRDQR
jgi:hypothetical protein